MRSAIPMVLTALALLATGCGSGAPGPGSATAAPPSTAVPQRPRDVAAHTVPACELLTSAQQGEFRVSRIEPGPTDGSQDPWCAYVVDPAGHRFTLTPWAGAGIESWLGISSAKAALIGVAGFPAARVSSVAGRGAPCGVHISVAEGRTLAVTGTATRPGVGEDELCGLTERVAGAALATALSRAR
ncbi:DUF3558 domain-containing protein [Crossiella cryophila]|uniref:DUF3558 domain-containing protein n=1 Tax=Crossiella cryophila TaxID=43355 RepID=A0A7W7FXJ8_9PSEU|nr:DUF3558 domain-containing protein [Crossiella cryophila]MBB4680723.1 hypothetical protein [Crossiella cryophila]